jgi:hypothetical protein
VVQELAVELLGRSVVRIDDHPVSGDAWRSRRAADVVKLLALAPDHRMHRLQVMEALWPDSEPAAAGTNLRKALHFARLALADERAIVNDHGVLVLAPETRVDTDVERIGATSCPMTSTRPGPPSRAPGCTVATWMCCARERSGRASPRWTPPMSKRHAS